jgi:hypothetical protein
MNQHDDYYDQAGITPCLCGFLLCVSFLLAVPVIPMPHESRPQQIFTGRESN